MKEIGITFNADGSEKERIYLPFFYGFDWQLFIVAAIIEIIVTVTIFILF